MTHSDHVRLALGAFFQVKSMDSRVIESSGETGEPNGAAKIRGTALGYAIA